MNTIDNNLPRVSFILLVYNQERYVYDSVTNAIKQDYQGDIEIIISNDASTDNSDREIKRAIQDNPTHRTVSYNVNKKNLGIGRHLYSICKKATGDILVGAAGDDISELNRCSVLVKYFFR